MVESDYIVLLWTALLLDKRVIVYTADANFFFYVAKALTLLLFPLTWPFSKGIAPNLELLATPTPYFFGIYGLPLG